MVEANRMSIPEGGLASFLTSNLDEIDDNVLAFGQPSGINSMSDVANRMAQMGRGGDNFVVHASEREMMVPREVIEKNPGLQRQIMQSIAAEGGDPNAYIVGSDANSINPMTGQREFFFKRLVRGIKKAVKSVVSVVKKIAPIVLPIALNFVFPGLGAVASGALGSGVASLIQGKSIKDSLKSALIGGVTGGIASGVSGAIGGEGFVAGVKQGFTGTPGMGAFEVRPSVKEFFGGAPAVGTPATPLPGATPDVAAQTGAPSVAEAPKGLLDRTKDFLIKPGPTQGEIFTEAGKLQGQAISAGLQLTDTAAIAAATKALTPGIISKYGTLALVGGLGAAAAGAFSPPEPINNFEMGFQAPTQEEIDAGSMFASGVPDPVQYAPSDLLIAPPIQYNPEDLLQQADYAPAPNAFELVAPPPFQPIQFGNMSAQNSMPQGQMQGGQNFGFDRFGNPVQSVYAAAEGGAINQFPRRSGFISGPGTETSDSIPAMLSDGEFVMTAQAVRGLGGGSRENGVRKMYDMMRMFEGGAVT
jgi:hypothetical protein